VNQQINLYQKGSLRQIPFFPLMSMLSAAGVAALAMLIIYGFAWQRVVSAERELLVVARQENTSVQRLQSLKPMIDSLTGERSWPEQLADTLRQLQERQAVLSLVQGASRSETLGFSRHLRALARQDVEGIWLTSVRLSANGNDTRLEGRAIRAELVPLFIHKLTAEPPFATQRFTVFRIDGSTETEKPVFLFSVGTNDLLVAAAGPIQ